MVVASIFVQVSSFQDYELPLTIYDCIDKSSGNNIINFGVSNCYFENDKIEVPNLYNVKFEENVAPNKLGVGIGRYIANLFYDGEDYYFQIDSHSRFEKNWDEFLISDYLYYKDAGLNPVLTTYPGIYMYENGKEKLLPNDSTPYIGFNRSKESQAQFLKDKILPQTAEYNKEGNIFTKGVSGAHVFGPGDLHLIEPNKKILHWGEETLYSVRFYTHGYDLLIPRKNNVYHLYYNSDSEEMSRRRLPGNYFKKETEELLIESLAELARIVDNNVIGDQALGSKRGLDEYERYANIDFKTGRIG
jgi:hypothetical protein